MEDLRSKRLMIFWLFLIQFRCKSHNGLNMDKFTSGAEFNKATHTKVQSAFADAFAKVMENNLEKYRERWKQDLSEVNFHPLMRGIFKDNGNGTVSLVRPKPFTKS